MVLAFTLLMLLQNFPGDQKCPLLNRFLSHGNAAKTSWLDLPFNSRIASEGLRLNGKETKR